MTKEIRLTQGQVTIVDDWRYDELNQYKWFALWSPKTRSFYAGRNSATVGGKRTTVSMHMVIAGTPRGMQTDHVDHDTLNNTEANLRVCTASQNKQNCVRRSDNTSGYKGVFPAHSRWGWQAVIGVDKKIRYLGTYSTREEAARAYDKAARELHGEFAKLNFE